MASSDNLNLQNGARVAVVGGGPAGSFFTIFFLQMAARQNLQIDVDIYEPRNFKELGPPGCNMCGGIISENLVRALASEGINLPPQVIRRSIEAYVMHTDVGRTRIAAYRAERRIAAIYRGAGPRNWDVKDWQSFDQFLLDEAVKAGASVVKERVREIKRNSGLPQIVTETARKDYDFVVVASGVNSLLTGQISEFTAGYQPPKASKAFICEMPLSEVEINHYLGNAMHVFLLDIPRLHFAAIIPKVENVTVCMIGDQIDRTVYEEFFQNPVVRQCFPPGYQPPEKHCRCAPSLNSRGARNCWGDRIVAIGDSGVTRLNKDGINGAYLTAKAAARTALLHGISGKSFSRYYAPFCRRLEMDNRIGHLIFSVLPAIKPLSFLRRILLRQVHREQSSPLLPPRLSSILWDMFTGSASYASVCLRMIDPRLTFGLLKTILFYPDREQSYAFRKLKKEVRRSDLGGLYRPGEIIFRTGDYGDCMYIVQFGQVEILVETPEMSKVIVEIDAGGSFGETALLSEPIRRFTARAKVESSVLAIDRNYFLQRVHDDPSFALTLLHKLSNRLVYLGESLKQTDLESNRKLINEFKNRQNDLF